MRFSSVASQLLSVRIYLYTGDDVNEILAFIFLHEYEYVFAFSADIDLKF